MPELFEHITSTDNLNAAWEKVADSAGAPGIDNVTIADYAKRLERNLTTLRDELLAGGYHPLPVKRIYVGKRNGGLRPIGIPSVRDRIAQAAVTLPLSALLEPTFESCSYAYRPGRSWPDAVEAVCELRDCGYRHVLRAQGGRGKRTRADVHLLPLPNPPRSGAGVRGSTCEARCCAKARFRKRGKSILYSE